MASNTPLNPAPNPKEWWNHEITLDNGQTYKSEYDHATLYDLLSIAKEHATLKQLLIANPLATLQLYEVGRTTRAINVWLGRHPKDNHQDPDPDQLIVALLDLLENHRTEIQCSG